MNSRGQLQLEAIACFAAFLGILALFVAVIGSAQGEAERAMQALESRALAEECCILADAVFSAGIEGLAVELPCVGKGNAVKAWEKESGCVARNVRLVPRNGKNVLEVGLSGHYR